MRTLKGLTCLPVGRVHRDTLSDKYKFVHEKACFVPSGTSTMNFLCEKCERCLAINYFHKK